MVQSPNNIVYASPVTPTSGYRLSGSVGSVDMSLLLDTGAAVTLLREDTWLQVAADNPQALRPWSAGKLVSAGGTPLTIHGCANIELKLGTEKFSTDVVVVSPLTSEAIIGLDFLMEQQASIDLTSKTLHLRERGCDLPLRDPVVLHETTAEVPVRAAMTVEIPPRSMRQVTGDTVETVKGTWLLQEATDKNLPFAVASALVEPTSTTVPLRILNPTEDPVTVYGGTLVATLQGVEVPSLGVEAVGGGEPVDVGGEKQKILWDLVENSGAELSSGEKELFYHLLLSYADVLACSTTDLGKTDRLQHHIRTGDATPIRQPVRRVSPHRREGNSTAAESDAREGSD